MHFRVITQQEYDETITLINKYLIEEIKRDFMDKTMESIKAISAHMYESLGLSLDPVKRLQDQLATQIATIKPPTIAWPTLSPSTLDMLRSVGDFETTKKTGDKA